jgi:hypothetical protein
MDGTPHPNHRGEDLPTPNLLASRPYQPECKLMDKHTAQMRRWMKGECKWWGRKACRTPLPMLWTGTTFKPTRNANMGNTP